MCKVRLKKFTLLKRFITLQLGSLGTSSLPKNVYLRTLYSPTDVRMNSESLCIMGGSPGDISENPVRMNRAHSPSFPSLHLRYNSFSNPSLALPTSQFILQPFRCFTYLTAHSPTLLSLLLPHRIFTYVTWRAAHALYGCIN